MKKIKFLSAIALTLAMASCDNYDLPNPPGQTNPEPDGVFENSDITLEAPTSDINLVEFNKANKNVPVATVTNLVNFPKNYTLAIDVQVGSDANFTKYATVTTTMVDNVAEVNPDAFNGAIQQVITKDPRYVLSVPLRFVAYAELGSTRMRLGGINKVYCPVTRQVQMLDAEKDYEDAYYLVGDFCNWDISRALKMENSLGEGVSPYDNPVFALKIDAPTDGSQCRWKVIPASSYTAKNWDGALGCLPADATETNGKLIDAPEVNGDPKVDAGNITLTGPVLITIDLGVDSYSVSYALDVLYAFSTSTAKDGNRLYTDNSINYSGTTVLNSSWYLTGEPKRQSKVQWYQSPTVAPVDGTVETKDGETTITEAYRTGTMVANAGDRFPSILTGNHFYWVEINLVDLTYKTSLIEKMSVIGDHNDWKLATAKELTPSSDFFTWTAKDVHLTGAFKINCNGAWTISFGGARVGDTMGQQVYNVENVPGGPNCDPVTEGTYDISVSFATRPYTVTLTKK